MKVRRTTLFTQTSQTDFSQIRKQQIYHPIYDKHFAAKGQTITVSMAGPKPVNRQQVGFGWLTFVFFWPQWPHLKKSGKSYYETLGNPEIFSKWPEVQVGNMLSWCCGSLRITMEEYGQSDLIPPYPFWQRFDSRTTGLLNDYVLLIWGKCLQALARNKRRECCEKRL